MERRCGRTPPTSGGDGDGLNCLGLPAPGHNPRLGWRSLGRPRQLSASAFCWGITFLQWADALESTAGEKGAETCLGSPLDNWGLRRGGEHCRYLACRHLIACTCLCRAAAKRHCWGRSRVLGNPARGAWGQLAHSVSCIRRSPSRKSELHRKTSTPWPTVPRRQDYFLSSEAAYEAAGRLPERLFREMLMMPREELIVCHGGNFMPVSKPCKFRVPRQRGS